VDGVSSRVAFLLSTDGALTDVTVTDPQGMPLSAGPGIEPMNFGCVRGFAVERPVAGDWTVRASGTGTYWLTVHVRSDLGLDDAAFVAVAGLPPHEGFFKIHGQPVTGRPATLQARVTREEISDATFDLVSMSGARLQTIELAPITNSSTEREYLGEVATLPRVPFRVRVTGRDRTGALYQRVSGAAFHAATIEVVPPLAVTLARGAQTAVRVNVRNVGAPTQLQVVGALGAAALLVEPGTLQLGANESRDVIVRVDVPASSTSLFSEIVVTAENPADPAAANSAIIRATVEP
jgi:hypothetical protein